MRLLVVSQYFWPENFRVNDLVAEMGRRGHQVTVLTGLPNYPEGVIHPGFAADPAGFTSFHGAEVLRVPIAPRGQGAPRLILNYLSFVLTAGLIGPLRLRGRSFDAIFVFGSSPPTACIPALLIGRLKSVPVFFWVLDLWPETLSAVGAVRSPWILSLVGKMVGAIYRRCRLVLGQSRAFEASIAARSGDATRFRFFPAWVEPAFDGGSDSVDPAPEVDANRGRFNLLFAGNIGDAQDFPAILDAADALRDRVDIRWLIVGDGRTAPWVRSEIARRTLGETVRMLGRHPLDRMPAFFRGADALLVTLRRDPVFSMTIPGKLQTYLATGLPVVGMMDGEGARIIRESGAGVVAPAGGGAELAALVREMSNRSPVDRKQMGARGLAYARREFDRDRLITELESWMAPVLRQ